MTIHLGWFLVAMARVNPVLRAALWRSKQKDRPGLGYIPVKKTEMYNPDKEQSFRVKQDGNKLRNTNWKIPHNTSPCKSEILDYVYNPEGETVYTGGVTCGWTERQPEKADFKVIPGKSAFICEEIDRKYSMLRWEMFSGARRLRNRPVTPNTEPVKYFELSLVHCATSSGRKYWRIAGEQYLGMKDYIRADGPDYPVRETFVPANFRRSSITDRKMIQRKGKHNSVTVLNVPQQPAGSQVKRYRIATLPIAIRFARAVALKQRLDAQAEKAFNKGNIARHDALDARANAVTNWLVQVATVHPDLAFKKPAKQPTTDQQKMQAAFKKLLRENRTVVRSDQSKARKIRAERLERQQKWSTRLARTNGAHAKYKK